jgi:hypothetical protein
MKSSNAETDTKTELGAQGEHSRAATGWANGDQKE